jgi:Zn-dependent protease with chaperone function
MRILSGMLFVLCVSTAVLPEEPVCVNRYYEELEIALENKNTTLAQVSTLGSGPALALLRVSQWRNYLARTQRRRPGLRDKMGYFFMENEIQSVADRCYVLLPEEMPLLYATVESYAQILKIPTPLILFVDDRKLFDASAAAWTHRSGFLILSRGLFEETSEEEFCGLVAHEMGYIVERYQAKMSMYFTPVAIAVFVLVMFAVYKLLASSPQLSWWHLFGASTMIGGYGVFATLYWCFLARRYEHAADRAAALISPENGLAMIKALERGQQENFGGDLLLAKQLTSTLTDLTPEERMKTCFHIEKIQREAQQALVDGRYDLGALGTNNSLASRRSYFQGILNLVPEEASDMQVS